MIYTDAARVYDRLSKDGLKHEKINHSEGVYVVGDLHASTIEGFWSVVKRGIDDTYHAVSPKRLQGYVNECVWRYNQRGDARSMFAQLILQSASPIR